MTTVHLVDGTFELFRAFYGSQRDGRAPRPLDAVSGLLRSLLRLVVADGATHIAVAFDHVIESFRNELFVGYKTGAGIDPMLAAQFEYAEVASAAFGAVVWPMVEYEADDALATAAHRFAAEAHVVIASPDKDLMQCVRGDRIVSWDRIRDRRFDEAGVREKFGVSPTSIPDWLALVGDTSDGIPGLPKWGEKSASAVLARYEHLEAIPDDHRVWDISVRSAMTLAEILREQRPDAMLYRTLATLRTDVPIGETLADLEWKGADRNVLQSLCAETGDTGLLDRIPRFL